jgi:hypothetical protein
MLNENEQNELFIKEFNHFKINPEDYKIKKEGLLSLATISFFSIFLFSLMIFNMYESENGAVIVWVIFAYLALGSIGLYLLFGHIIKINERFTNFNKMIYRGKVSELFIEMNHPVIKEFKDQLIHDLKHYNGIRGSRAYDIHYHMTDSRIKKVMKEKELANQAIEEIENI